MIERYRGTTCGNTGSTQQKQETNTDYNKDNFYFITEGLIQKARCLTKLNANIQMSYYVISC